MFGLMLRKTHEREMLALRADVDREREACARANAKISEPVTVKMKRGRKGYWRANINAHGRNFLVTNIGVEYTEAKALEKPLRKVLNVSSVIVEE